MEHRNVHLHFARTEGGTRLDYRLLEPTEGRAGTWVGETTTWSPGAAGPHKEAVDLVPDTARSHELRRDTVHAWKTPDGKVEWTIGTDAQGAPALTETRSGEVQWTANLAD